MPARKTPAHGPKCLGWKGLRVQALQVHQVVDRSPIGMLLGIVTVVVLCFFSRRPANDVAQRENAGVAIDLSCSALDLVDFRFGLFEVDGNSKEEIGIPNREVPPFAGSCRIHNWRWAIERAREAVNIFEMEK